MLQDGPERCRRGDLGDVAGGLAQDRRLLFVEFFVGQDSFVQQLF